MSLAIIMPNRNSETLVAALTKAMPETRIRVWPDLGPPEEIRFAVLWQHPPGILHDFPQLQAVTSYGAGVDAILADPQLPSQLPIGRVLDQGLVQQMSAYLLAVVLSQTRRLEHYDKLQKQGQWQPDPIIPQPRIGILGLGHLGLAAAKSFRSLGYPVSAWRRRAQAITEIPTHSGSRGLLDLAAHVDYLICLLPLTAATNGILNRRLFAAMRPQACLINVGRGDHLNESELIQALDQKQLRLAILDVFAQEPLPTAHPFWNHPAIRITPHIASLTDPERVAQQIAASYRSVRAGKGPLHAIDRALGY